MATSSRCREEGSTRGADRPGFVGAVERTGIGTLLPVLGLILVLTVAALGVREDSQRLAFTMLRRPSQGLLGGLRKEPGYGREHARSLRQDRHPRRPPLRPGEGGGVACSILLRGRTPFGVRQEGSRRRLPHQGSPGSRSRAQLRLQSRALKSAPDNFRRPTLGASDRIAVAIATGFGAGFVPVAPGTAGTAIAIPFFLALARVPAWLQVVTTAAFVALAVYAASRAALYFGASDDGHIVSDEIAGYLVTMLLVPVTLKTVIAGFVLFRVFDTTKPWPASYFDKKVHTGFGNVMDDVVAGLYGRACMALLVWLWP